MIDEGALGGEGVAGAERLREFRSVALLKGRLAVKRRATGEERRGAEAEQRAGRVERRREGGEG